MSATARGSAHAHSDAEMCSDPALDRPDQATGPARSIRSQASVPSSAALPANPSPRQVPPLGIGVRSAPDVAYPKPSALSERLLWRGYGLEDDL